MVCLALWLDAAFAKSDGTPDLEDADDAHEKHVISEGENRFSRLMITDRF